jgi:hypothetical protein
MSSSDMSAQQTLKAAHTAYEDALAAHWEAEGRFELAVLRGNPDERERAREALHSATTQLAQTRSAVVAAQTTAAPSFEDLLRNPYLQFDRDGVVLSSIRQYQQAPIAAGRTKLDPAVAQAGAGWAGLTGIAGLSVTVTGNGPFAAQEGWVAEEATTPGRQLVRQ